MKNKIIVSVLLGSLSFIAIAHADQNDQNACSKIILNSAKQKTNDPIHDLETQKTALTLVKLLNVNVSTENDNKNEWKSISDQLHQSWDKEISNFKVEHKNNFRYSDQFGITDGEAMDKIFYGLIRYETYKFQNRDILGDQRPWGGNNTTLPQATFIASILQELSADDCKFLFSNDLQLRAITNLSGFSDFINYIADMRQQDTSQYLAQRRDQLAKENAEKKEAKLKAAQKAISSGTLHPVNKKNVEFCERGTTNGMEIKTVYNALVKTYQYKDISVQDTTWLNGSKPDWSKSRISR